MSHHGLAFSYCAAFTFRRDTTLLPRRKFWRLKSRNALLHSIPGIIRREGPRNQWLSTRFHSRRARGELHWVTKRQSLQRWNSHGLDQTSSQNGDVPARTPTVPWPSSSIPAIPEKDGSPSSERDTQFAENDSDWTSESDSADDKGERMNGRLKVQTTEKSRPRETKEEAQRPQRDLFAKLPKGLYSKASKPQYGLLSRLLKPDPSLLLHNHPRSSTLSSLQEMSRLASGRPNHAPTPYAHKSSAAAPLATLVNIHPSVDPEEPALPPCAHGRRLERRPQDEDIEDTDSEDGNEDNSLPVSRSLAQKKLAALMDLDMRRKSDRGPPPQRKHPQTGVRSDLVGVAPIPMDHPYDKSAPAPPMTPRTTRRQMLQAELSESFRRHLLWERQVSRVKLPNWRGVVGGGLNSKPSIVPKESTLGRRKTATHPRDSSHRQPVKQNDADHLVASHNDPVQGHEKYEGDRDQRWRRAMARYRSWAGEYHYSGW